MIVLLPVLWSVWPVSANVFNVRTTRMEPFQRLACIWFNIVQRFQSRCWKTYRLSWFLFWQTDSTKCNILNVPCNQIWRDKNRHAEGHVCMYKIIAFTFNLGHFFLGINLLNEENSPWLGNTLSFPQTFKKLQKIQITFQKWLPEKCEVFPELRFRENRFQDN